MSIEVPSRYRLVYSQAQIEQRIQTLSADVSSWAKEVERSSGNQLLGLCVLRGAVFFFSDLLKNISESVEPVFCRAESYSVENNQQSPRGVKVSLDDVRAEGRSILLVDDVCDTGATLAKLQTILLDLGAIEVRSIVLVHRQLPTARFRPTWSAFKYGGPEWFVGYGMDDKDRFRNLPEVYVIQP